MKTTAAIRAAKWRKDNPNKTATHYRHLQTDNGKGKNRTWNLKAKFNLTPEQYNTKLDRQGHACAICGHPDGVGGGSTRETKRLYVDHCHFAKRNRGLLCDRCNRGLGFFRDHDTDRDSITHLQNAIQYLLDHQG